MTTTVRFVSHDGALVGPGDYDIVGTTVRVTSVQRSNGLVIDQQHATITHTVAPRAVVDPCIHCGEPRPRHSEDREVCVKAGYYGNRYTPANDLEPNAAGCQGECGIHHGPNGECL